MTDLPVKWGKNGYLKSVAPVTALHSRLYPAYNHIKADNHRRNRNAIFRIPASHIIIQAFEIGPVACKKCQD